MGQSGSRELVKYCHEELEFHSHPKFLLMPLNPAIIISRLLPQQNKICFPNPAPSMNDALNNLARTYQRLAMHIKNVSQIRRPTFHLLFTQSEMMNLSLPIMHVFTDALLHPAEYDLTPKKTKNVLDLMEEMVDIKDYGMIERNEIKAMLRSIAADAEVNKNKPVTDDIDKIQQKFKEKCAEINTQSRCLFVG